MAKDTTVRIDMWIVWSGPTSMVELYAVVGATNHVAGATNHDRTANGQQTDSAIFFFAISPCYTTIRSGQKRTATG